MAKILKINLTEPQMEMYYAQEKYPAFVAGFGSGKSYSMAQDAFLDAVEGGSEAKILIGEPTHDLLRTVAMANVESLLINNGIKYKTNKSEKTIIPARGLGIGSFFFKSYTNPERIIGDQYFRAHLDELDTIPMEQADHVWVKVLGRMRQKPATYKKISDRCPRSISTYTTPEGYRFVYNQWGDDNIKKQDGYRIIRASTYSNPYLPDDYIQSILDRYPAALIKAYIDGEFVNLTQGAVYPEFDRSENCTDMTWKDIDNQHEFLIGMDFNVYNCTATVCINHKNGNLYAVDEFVKVRDTEEMCQKIKEKYGEAIIKRCIIYPDSSGKNHHTVGADRSDLDIIRSHGFKMYVESTNPRVSERITSVNSIILNGNGIRRFFVNVKCCKQLVKSLEQQAFDKNGNPDKTAGFDHSAETLGYISIRTHPIVRHIFNGQNNNISRGTLLRA